MDNICVLGINYSIHFKSRNDDKILEDCDGYCDKTTKEIVVLDVDRKNSNLHNPEWYKKKVLRHEIVHAFLIESGLQENVNWDEELLVDWIAVQGQKIYKAWQEADCLG
jgi:hypothetical protein